MYHFGSSYTYYVYFFIFRTFVLKIGNKPIFIKIIIIIAVNNFTVFYFETRLVVSNMIFVIPQNLTELLFYYYFTIAWDISHNLYLYINVYTVYAYYTIILVGT